VVEIEEMGLLQLQPTFLQVLRPNSSSRTESINQIRYGNPNALTAKDSQELYGEVAKTFSSQIAPQILQTYLQQIDKWVAKTAWLSKRCLSFTIQFLDECVRPKVMWSHLKPHIESLTEHLLFPVLCQSEEDLELFTDEPTEYLHRKLNYYEDVSSPDSAATSFLDTLTKNRRKQTFVVLNYVNSIVGKYETAPDDQKNPREKEGALRMIGCLASVILGKKSPIADQVEYFLVRHVFPEFHSEHGFLRARACDTMERFEQLKFKDSQNLVNIYQNIIRLMADEALPVRVTASLSLQSLIRHPVIHEAMKQNIPQIMNQLLKLANETDVDALANVMEDFVETFAPELAPFAIALCEQLKSTYLRIVGDLLQRNQERDKSDDYGEYLDDKSITALGVLQTIGTLILTLETAPEVMLHIEAVLMPVIEITLENKLYGRSSV
jgi:importin-7